MKQIMSELKVFKSIASLKVVFIKNFKLFWRDLTTGYKLNYFYSEKQINCTLFGVKHKLKQ